MTMCMGGDQTLILGGTEGLIGVYKLETNSLITMQS
jgi:hypothetical protein